MDAQHPGALSAPSDVHARLRAAGLKTTRQRITVLAVLDHHVEHLSADELVAELAERDLTLPRSTVFKVLDDLVGAGLVLRADLAPGASRYESADARAPHHHFVCRSCGTIDDIPVTESVADLARSVRHHHVDTVEVVFRGLCRRCASRSD